MTVKWRKRTVVQFTPVSLFISVVVVALAIAFAAALTYYLTRRAYDTNHKHSDHPGVKDDSPSAEELLLPTNVRPLVYDLSIKTYLPFYVDFPPEKNLTFDGQVEISMMTLDSIKSIILNAKNITVVPEKCEVTVNQEKIGIKSVMEHGRLEKVEFVLESAIPKDKEVVLKVIYSGLISNTLGGLYQATYVHTDGTTKIAAVSQMEPTDARRMVPCFDEPKFKANWTVTVVHPKGTRAASNGIEKNGEGEVSGDWIISKFETTPRMSSYLLAVLISEFEFIQGFTKRGVRFRIWSRPEAKAMTAYALQAGIKCLEFYERYFDIKFPLPKQDMVALPDFSAGAMENWGLITYRENSLLYDDRYYAPSNKQRVALVVAHELAHQWFGNLVTLKWWDDLWLNEGFATFVEYLGTDEISDKHMRMMDYFLVSSFDSGLHGDEVASSHPLSFRVDKASEVFEAFDGVTYDKGASVLTMISSLIGEETFKQSVTHYLKRFSYNNAQAADLWIAFDETVKDVPGPRGSRLKIAEFADQWTSQMGFPMVTAESVNATTLKISQRRYKTSEQAREPEKYRNPKYGFKWDVPLWYQEGNDTEVKLAWLSRDEPLYLHTKTPDSSVVMNANRHGFYRQNYDANGWKKIIDRMHQNHEEYSARTRNAIISDAFAAAMINQLDYETVFRLLEYAKKEKEFLPWEEIMHGFSSILNFFGNEPESKMAKNYMMGILKPIYESSDIDFLASHYKNESLFFEMNLQQSVIGTYCSIGSRDCLAKLKALFDKEVMQKCKEGQSASQCVKVAAPLRSMVYCYGVKEGGDAAFDKVMGLYNAEGVQLEKDHLLDALGCHKDITALKGLLLLALDRNSSFVRLQDVRNVFEAVSANPVGEEFMFNFLIERWEEILESLPTEHRAVEAIISECAAGIRSEQQIEQMRNLQKNGLRASQFGAFDEEIEKAQHKVEWIKQHFRKLADFFKQASSL